MPTFVEPPESSGGTTYTAGDGLELSGTEFTTGLKSNGGLVIESTDLAVDLGASSITGTLAVADGGTGATSARDAREALELGTGDDVQFNSLGVGTAASTTPGEIRATNDITAFYSSDKRLKDNITPITEPLSKLSQLGGYTFDWIPKEGIHSHEGRDVGVVAQEVEEVLPEVTTTRDNGYKAVKYEKIVPLLIECIKAQQSQIDELKERLDKKCL